MFNRFQILCFARALVGMLFLLPAILLKFTPAADLPGYVNPLGSRDFERRLLA